MVELVRHPLRIADQLDERPERRAEVVDRLPCCGTSGDRQRAEELLHAFRLHVLHGIDDVGDVERDVMARPVGVLGMRGPLIGRLVLEQLDRGGVPDADRRDLRDDRARIDVEQVVHERARGITEGTERERRACAHHILEPLDRLLDVGNGDTDVIRADEPELAAWNRRRRSGTRPTRGEERSHRGRRSERRALYEKLSARHGCPEVALAVVPHVPHLASLDESRGRTLSRRVPRRQTLPTSRATRGSAPARR